MKSDAATQRRSDEGEYTQQPAELRSQDVPSQVIHALQAARSPIVISHVVPDADALGSSLALVLALRESGRAPKFSLPAGSLSQKLSFLVERAAPALAALPDFTSADSFLVVDTAKKERCNIDAELKKADWSSGRSLVNIDHHATNTQFGSVNWVEAHASSTCELVYRLLRAGEWPISPLAASLLYAGIQTDTLGFSLPTTNAIALRAAADLVELGADVGELGERLLRSQKQSEFELLRVVYANTKIVGDGSIAYSSAGYHEIHHAGCTAADIDDQINVPRSLEGVRLAMLFSEGNKGKTRINFRSSGDVEVLGLAAEFGGGGHSQAAGAILNCGLEEAIARVVPRAVDHIQRFRA